MVEDLSLLQKILERVLTMEVNLRAKPDDIFNEEFWLNYFYAQVMPYYLDEVLEDHALDKALEMAQRMAKKMIELKQQRLQVDLEFAKAEQAAREL